MRENVKHISRAIAGSKYGRLGAICLVLVIAAACLCTCENLVYPSAEQEYQKMRVLADKGNMFVYSNQTDSALACYSMVLSRCNKEMPDSMKRICVKAANNMGYLYLFRRHNYMMAYSYLLRALDISKELGDTLTTVYANLNIGNVFINYDNLDQAYQHYRKAFYGALKKGDRAIAVTCIINMLPLAQADSAKYPLQREIAAFVSRNLRSEVMGNYAWLRIKALAATRKGQYGEAIDLMRQSIGAIDDKLSPQVYRWGCMQNMGELMLKTHHYAEGKRITRTCLGEAGREGFHEVEASAYSLLSDFYVREGRWDSAYFFKSRMAMVCDTFFNARSYGQMHDMASNLEFKKLNDKMGEMDSHRRMAYYVSWLCLICAAVLLASSIIYYIQNKKLKQHNKRLYMQAQQAVRSYQREKESRAYYESKIAQINNKLNESTEPVPANATEPRQKDNDLQDDGKYHSSSLSENRYYELLEKIQTVLDNADEILSSSFSIDRLSRLVNSNYHYVSEVINKNFGKNFNMMLGELRVRHACMMLVDDEHYGNMTIETIASECGFKSRSNFVSVFKKVTGLTPSNYKRMSREVEQ